MLLEADGLDKLIQEELEHFSRLITVKEIKRVTPDPPTYDSPDPSALRKHMYRMLEEELIATYIEGREGETEMEIEGHLLTYLTACEFTPTAGGKQGHNPGTLGILALDDDST